ncbi:MAG: phytanoyl-CoA dioxygenase family protein [Pseudomonadota bacterium]
MEGQIDHKSASQSLWRDGVCTVPDAIEADLLRRCREWLMSDHPALFTDEARPEKLFVCPGRFYVALQIKGLFARPEILLPRAIDAILHDSLGPAYVFESWGLINALPGAAEQHWHRDGGVLFPSHPLEAMLPATAITVAVPLVDLNEKTGTTGFALGSHRSNEHVESPDYEPYVSLGSAMLWDYRVFHKGMPNRSAAARPFLYATFCREWWMDTGNHEDQVRLMACATAVEAMDAGMRKRLARAILTE